MYGTEKLCAEWAEGPYLIMTVYNKYFPFLSQNQTSVHAYFPSDQWYDFYTGRITSRGGGEWIDLHTPLDKINVHIRAGSIVPMQQPALTTTAA